MTVNPLPPPSMLQFNQLRSSASARSSRNNLEPSIKPSQDEERDNSISSADYDINQKNPDQTPSSTETATDPIYAEIKIKDVEPNSSESIKSNSETVSKQQNRKSEHQETTSNKKEIEYWQITAKEVVKFRPCTETFIVRE